MLELRRGAVYRAGLTCPVPWSRQGLCCDGLNIGAGIGVSMIGLFFRSLFVGAKRRWKSGIGFALGVLGAVWLITEVLTRSVASTSLWLDGHGDSYLIGVGLAALLGFLWHIYEPRSVEFLIPTTPTKITIRFGDLLKCDTHWLIGVNEYFDSRLREVVAPQSLHGQIISTVFEGDEALFRRSVDAALAGMPSEEEPARTIEPKARYEIGTTAVLRNGQRQIFLMAMSHTALGTHKAETTVSMLWEALMGGLLSVRNHGNGEPLSLPLVGNGQSSVNIKPQYCLRLVTLALVVFGRRLPFARSVTIVLPEDCFDVLDLREIKRDWSKG